MTDDVRGARAKRAFETQRARMVDRQLARRGIVDTRVLAAMRNVPREAFVPSERRERAYSDEALPIGHRQTISQPYVVAAMYQALALEGHEHVLEIGTGSGYSAAVLGYLADDVTTIERHADLATGARDTLRALGVDNVAVHAGDGSNGWPTGAPYDAIAVHALTRDPGPYFTQLAAGGRLVVPLLGGDGDLLTLFTESGGDYDRHILDVVAFVPLVEGGEGTV